jgi:triphosphoribosyl-dephospho-CoA synthetase
MNRIAQCCCGACEIEVAGEPVLNARRDRERHEAMRPAEFAANLVFPALKACDIGRLAR